MSLEYLPLREYYDNYVLISNIINVVNLVRDIVFVFL